MAEKFNIPAEYLHFADVFLKKLAAKLFERFDINKHWIIPKLGKQAPYDPIDSLKLVQLKTLKTYIKTNLANSFI